MTRSCPRIAAVAIAFNEERRIGSVIDRMAGLAVDVAVTDDGSTDGTASVVRNRGVRLLHHPARRGVGAAIRSTYGWARAEGYDICVIMAGNDKDRPVEIGALTGPIIRGEADLTQGSRYLAGGAALNLPFWRRVATRWIHPWLFSLVAGRRMTDTTNGFRAIRLSILDDPRIALDDRSLDGYGLEPYLLMRAIHLGYAVREVPVSKVYPPAGQPYTKMRAGADWWRIVRPIVQLSYRDRR